MKNRLFPTKFVILYLMIIYSVFGQVATDTNKLPVANFEISTVSGGEFNVPVWIKFYPSGTYDPDGYIVLFEMDMNGDGMYEIVDKTLRGGSYEFTSAGEYTASVRVTDDKGGVTSQARTFIINNPNQIFSEVPAPVIKQDEQKLAETEINKPAVQPQETESDKIIIPSVDTVIEPEIREEIQNEIVEPVDTELNKTLDATIEQYKHQEELPALTKIEENIKKSEPNIATESKPVPMSILERSTEDKFEYTATDKQDNSKYEKLYTTVGKSEPILLNDIKLQPVSDAYVYAYSYRNWNQANFGKYEMISAGWHSTGGEKSIYLKFDTPNVKNESLTKAVLKLYHNKTIGKNIQKLGIYKLLESWEEGEGTFNSGQTEPIDSTGAINWESQPQCEDNHIVTFKPSKKCKQFVEIDITLLVKKWLQGIPNHGLVIKPVGKLSGRSPISVYEFYSREHDDKTKVPTLELIIN